MWLFAPCTFYLMNIFIFLKATMLNHLMPPQQALKFLQIFFILICDLEFFLFACIWIWICEATCDLSRLRLFRSIWCLPATFLLAQTEKQRYSARNPLSVTFPPLNHRSTKLSISFFYL